MSFSLHPLFTLYVIYLVSTHVISSDVKHHNDKITNTITEEAIFLLINCRQTHTNCNYLINKNSKNLVEHKVKEETTIIFLFSTPSSSSKSYFDSYFTI